MSEKIRLTERWRVIERKEGDDATRTHSHGKRERERERERVREPLFKVSLQKNWQIDLWLSIGSVAKALLPFIFQNEI